MTLRCPGCGGAAGPGGTVVGFDRIWQALEAEFDVIVPADVREAYAPQPTTRLAPCTDCGLRFFTDAVPGGPDFYALLDSGPGYYNKLTWEGRSVIERLRDDDDVVDFGCGDGALLRSMPARSGRRVGVDHNPTAIAALRAAGVEGHGVDFEEFGREHPEEFDVALAMQVVEHLPDIPELMVAARRVLRPGGRLFVAVPNAARTTERFEPLDHPPHHLTRWRPEDLARLAARHGFDVADFSFEPAPRAAVRRAVSAHLPGGRGSDFVAKVLARAVPPPLLPGLAARVAPDDPAYGHTMLVELRRPAAVAS